MKKMFIYLSVVCFIAGLSLTECEAQPVVLKCVTAWQSDYFDSSNFLESVDAINKAAEGKFVIKYLGGPEVVPSRQQGQAVRDGVVDIAFFAMAYTAGAAHAVHYGLLSPFSPWEEREKGVLDLWNKIYKEKLNALCLGKLGWGKQFNFFLGKKKVTKPDFSGLKIRSSPALEPVITKLGGARVGMSMEELYTAMDRGVIDGYGTAFLGTRDLALHEVTKYVIDHPFWFTDTRALINLGKWQALPKDLRDFIVKLFKNEEKKSAARAAKAIEQERAELKKAGLEFIGFASADAKYFYKVVSDAGWEYARKKAPEYEAEFKKLFTR